MTTSPSLEVLASAELLAQHAADLVLAAARAKTDGPFAIALSGGSTPRRLYELLATPSRLGAFPWARAHWFWGDERFVPPDDPASNVRMVRQAMLARAPVPAGNIHPMPTVGLTPAAAAAQYEEMLKSFYGAKALSPDKPLFDMVLLGLGTDGHTASLFPGQPALAERWQWASATEAPDAVTRITLTYPALESSREALFLVAGADKKAMLAEVLAGNQALPAARLRPHGSLRFLADRAAAP